MPSRNTKLYSSNTPSVVSSAVGTVGVSSEAMLYSSNAKSYESMTFSGRNHRGLHPRYVPDGQPIQEKKTLDDDEDDNGSICEEEPPRRQQRRGNLPQRLFGQCVGIMADTGDGREPEIPQTSREWFDLVKTTVEDLIRDHHASRAETRRRKSSAHQSPPGAYPTDDESSQSSDDQQHRRLPKSRSKTRRVLSDDMLPLAQRPYRKVYV